MLGCWAGSLALGRARQPHITTRPPRLVVGGSHSQVVTRCGTGGSGAQVPRWLSRARLEG